MPAILDIPPELLHEILAPLEISQLSLLSRSCKALHFYLQPHIYHTFDWIWNDDAPSPPYLLSLRTLLANNRLANFVRIIRFHGGGILQRKEWEEDRIDSEFSDRLISPRKARSVCDVGQRVRSTFRHEERQKMINLISQIAFANPYFWISEFDRGNVDVLVGMILYQAQSIERLDLGYGYIQHANFVPLCFRRLLDINKDSPVYPNLKSVELGIDGPESPLGMWADIDLFRLFLFLPRIENLNTTLLEPAIFAWPSPTMIPRPHLLTTLVLRKTTAPPNMLEVILSCTVKLKHLTYDYTRLVECYQPHWECHADHYDEGRGGGPLNALIEAHRLSKALSHVQNTLENLILRVRFQGDIATIIIDFWNENVGCGLTGRVRCLHKMHKLKTIEISWALLFGWEYTWRNSRRQDNREEFEWPAEMYHPASLEHDAANLWASVLPPQIERICMRDDMSDFTHYPSTQLDPLKLTRVFTATRGTLFPNLVQLDFTFVEKLYETHPWPLQTISKLRAICDAEGLHTAVVCEQRPR